MPAASATARTVPAVRFAKVPHFVGDINAEFPHGTAGGERGNQGPDHRPGANRRITAKGEEIKRLFDKRRATQQDYLNATFRVCTGDGRISQSNAKDHRRTLTVLVA